MATVEFVPALAMFVAALIEKALFALLILEKLLSIASSTIQHYIACSNLLDFYLFVTPYRNAIKKAAAHLSSKSYENELSLFFKRSLKGIEARGDFSRKFPLSNGLNR